MRPSEIGDMDAMKLQKWLEQGPSPDDVELLREYVDRYPYAGPLRMMLARASDLAQDLEKREDLLKAGAHVPSRRALFAFLMGPALVQQARAIHEEIEDAPDVSEEDLVEMVWHESSHADDEPSLRNEGDASHPDTDTVTDELSTRDAMVAAIASVLEKEMVEWQENSEDLVQKEDVPGDARESNPSDSASQGVTIPLVNDVPAPKSLFAIWLKQRAQETGFGKSVQEEQGASALIDAFLAKQDVRIGPIREGLESTEEWAKQGLVEDPSLVTETMAKLYAKQGQMGRARKAYKLLALKYPEKSVYFAAQLKKLRTS